MRALIDADILLYKHAAACERVVDWDCNLTTIYGDHLEIRDNIEGHLANLREHFDHLILCFSDTQNFRNEVYPDYKGNRSGKRKPCGFKPVLDWLQENYTWVSLPALEADDVMGLHAGGDKVILTEDKDLYQIPGKIAPLFSFSPDLITETLEEEGDYLFHLQCLTGDRVDNYPGIPGTGPKKAEAILEKAHHDGIHPETAILDAYLKAGLTEEDAQTQARCARILRDGEWDYGAQKPRLYTLQRYQ